MLILHMNYLYLQVIPKHILENARGFAIFSIFKAGFLFSARAGSGVVIARLDDGSKLLPQYSIFHEWRRRWRRMELWEGLHVMIKATML